MYNFIVNTDSKSGKKCRDVIESELEKRGVDYRIFLPECADQAKIIARQLCEEGETEIIAVGGDGTFHQVLNGIIDVEKVNLGVIPCGTGNDFAKKLGFSSKDPVRCLDIILNGECKKTDFLVIDGLRCLNVLGAGIDVDVLKRYSEMPGRGKIRYYISLVISLIKFKPYKIKVRIGEREEEHNALIAACANGSFFGGGIPIAPQAEIDDGKIDVMIADCIRKIDILPMLIKLMKGKILDTGVAELIRAEEVEIIPSEPCAIQIDGEIYENLDFKVKIVKDKLKVYRP